MSTWRETHHPARLGETLPDGVVRCHLSPRNCTLKEGQNGFCGVRGNRGGQLVTFNYGKGVHPTEETIETEAVNHFAPSTRILSLGNIGCMMNCDYCHNWKTSQSRHVDDRDVHGFSTEQVVSTAVRHGIPMLSWTYNDPVVWHEFVRDTARAARDAGLANLYKSAFFITPQAVEELLPVMDIFSISIKSMDPVYYRKLTKGWLEPVLEAARQVFRAGKHVEISTLMVTDVSDDEKCARDVAEWVARELSPTVPLHFVRFHPDYKMASGTRTPVERLYRARQVARAVGMQHVYLGNVHDPEATSTSCNGCGALLVHRFGLSARSVGLDSRGHCAACGLDAHVRQLPAPPQRQRVDTLPAADLQLRTFEWHGDIRSLHVQLRNPSASDVKVYYRPLAGLDTSWWVLPLQPGESYRLLLAMGSQAERGVEVASPSTVTSNLHEVFDRAHFPTVAVSEGRAASDVSPLPIFQPRPP